MKELKILCWNINGVRAATRKGFLGWLYKESPDILCLQETKANPEQLDKDLRDPHGYHAYWNYPGQGKGYSGVAIFTKEKPIKVQNGFGIPEFDTEGRTIVAEYPEYTLFNVYFPNGKKDETRLKYKMDFYEAFLQVVDSLKARGGKLIICGDFNTAHNEIDLRHPKANKNTSGFLPEERAWIDTYLSHGLVDIYRFLFPDKVEYTWWTYLAKAREHNTGWRLDYFMISEPLVPMVKDVVIHSEVLGSDHCPVTLKIEN